MINPKSIGIIMDGNRRYGINNNISNYDSYCHGLRIMLNLIPYVLKKKFINNLGFFALSIQNLERNQQELKNIMSLLNIVKNNKILHTLVNKININIIGDYSKYPKELRQDIDYYNKTFIGNDLSVYIYFIYSGTYDIEQSSQTHPDSIKENLLTTFDYDMIIRTGDRKRLSNFVLYQAASSEIYFSKKLWGDFNNRDLFRYIQIFQKTTFTYGR